MDLFQQDANGVGVYQGNSFYYDTRANFQLDNGAPAPALPAGMDQQVYEKGVRHAYNKNNSTVGGGPLPWPAGDTIIGNCSALLTAKAAREAASRPTTVVKKDP